MQDSTQINELIEAFHHASDSLTRYFAEQAHTDNDLLFAFDEIDKFLSSAATISLDSESSDSEQFSLFNSKANELILLIDRIMVFASNIRYTESYALLEDFLLKFVYWFAARGGKITSLTPVVNLIAARSNRQHDTEVLKQQLVDIEIIIKATQQTIRDDMDIRDPRRPWRVLLLNYAITATRTHQPELMDKAFQILIQHLPDDARQFFTEGMSQMVALDYPDSVKEVMQRYYQQYALQDIKNN